MPLFLLPFLAYDDFDVILPFSFAPKLLMSLKSSSKDDISGRLFGKLEPSSSWNYYKSCFAGSKGMNQTKKLYEIYNNTFFTRVFTCWVWSFSNDSVGVIVDSIGKEVSVYSGDVWISSFCCMWGTLLCIDRTAAADKCDMYLEWSFEVELTEGGVSINYWKMYDVLYFIRYYLLLYFSNVINMKFIYSYKTYFWNQFIL